MQIFLENRQALEERMDGMPGLEYRVIVEPKTAEEEARGIYVIRKQERIKRANYPDEIKILGTYYITGEFVFAAPSVENILSSRIVQSQNSI